MIISIASVYIKSVYINIGHTVGDRMRRIAAAGNVDRPVFVGRRVFELWPELVVCKLRYTDGEVAEWFGSNTGWFGSNSASPAGNNAFHNLPRNATKTKIAITCSYNWKW